MKSIIIILICLILFSCNSKTNSSNVLSPDSLAVLSKDKELSQLKDIADLKLNFLDGPESKVVDFFGEPDKRGDSPNGDNGYLIYYDLTKENNNVKTLVISYHMGDVDAVIAANDFGDNVTLPNGYITINRPQNFSSIYHDVDTHLNQIDALAKEIDTTKITPTKFFENDGHEIKVYRYKDNNKVGLIKVVYPLTPGDYYITCYYFDYNNKLMCQIQGDKTGGLYTDKSYVINDRVVKYLVGKDITPCTGTCEPTFNEFSEPYRLFKEVNN